MTSRSLVRAPAETQQIADGIGALRLLVVVGLVVDAASTFSDLGLAKAPRSTAAVTTLQLGLAVAAAAAVMWLRPRLALVLSTLVLVLALTVSPTSAELWLLVIVAITVGARAAGRVVLAVTVAEFVYVALFALEVERRSPGYGQQAAAVAGAFCLLGLGAGLITRRSLQVLDRRRRRLGELEEENAEIRATERLRLADDLQVVVTGGLTAIQHRLETLATHTEDGIALRRGLTEIDRESRAVLSELRSLLEILRRDPLPAPVHSDAGPRQRRRLVDVLTARRVRLAAVAAFGLLAVEAALSGGAQLPTQPETVAMLGWAACALAACRARDAAAVVAASALVVVLVSGTWTDWSVLPTVVLFFLASLRTGLRRLWVVLVTLVAYAALIALTVADWALPLTTACYVAALAMIAGLAAGHFLAEGRDSDRRQAGLLGDRDRLATQERAAVARDLHDVVAHQLSLTNLSIMSTSASTDPAKLSGTLQRVAESVQAAESELFELLHEMRGHPADVQATPLVLPSAGAESIARRLAATGFEPVITMDPEADELDVTTKRTLGRIMQEATTNIVRYAPAGSVCRFALTVADEQVRLRVSSPLAARERRSPLSLGWGLRGVAERVELSHGEFDAGPERGSWVVDVALPRSVDRDLALGLTA